jgi:CheY-like chemotaxis protein
MIDLLVPLGFKVIEARHGEEGIQQAIAQKPDLIITNLVMPILDGFETTRRLRKIPELTHIPIIAASASVFEFHQQESLAAGCNTFIAKPFYLEDMLALLQKYLNLHWIYSQETSDSGQPIEPIEIAEFSPDLMPGPSTEQAALLFDLGMKGDIGAILNLLDQIEIGNDPLKPFIHKVRQLAKNFKEEQICDLVQPYIK